MTVDKRYYDLLGAAYEVPLETARFDAFVDRAMAFFFSEPEDGTLASDLPKFSPDDATLDNHGVRIAALVEAACRRDTSPSGSFHAELTISLSTRRVTGNAAAAQLTGAMFPCSIDDLPMDHVGKEAIRSALASVKPQIRDRVVLSNVGADETRACLALIQRPPHDGEHLHVALSWIDWTDELLSHLADAFGLTPSETDVLQGFLNNLNQREVAELRNRSMETVKGQSKNILRKAGCARISDVVQLSASIAYLVRQMPQTVKPGIDTWETPKTNMSMLPLPDGRELAWYRVGSGSKKILFIHGFIQGPFFSPTFLRHLAKADVQLIAPSRPGFGYTSAARSARAFDETCISDTLALVAHLGMKSVPICIHQGGSSHGFRIANALGNKVPGILIVDGGIPIDDKLHVSKMDPQTRFAAMSIRHAPSVMKFAMRIGLPIYRQRGTKDFLQHQYVKSPRDLKTLENPELLAVQAQGLFHIVQQGVDTWMRDGAAAMADWSADLEAYLGPQVWLQAAECTVISAYQVADHMAHRPNVRFHIVEGHATTILHTAPELVCQELGRLG
jgi:pimeloyl-ACP methyl ester carboxylesterase/DNA-binding CsgD family transcriptional regulator